MTETAGRTFTSSARAIFTGAVSRRATLCIGTIGDGTFTDVTEKAGVPGTGYGLGCTVGDYDNDGHPDLYVMQYGKNVLYHNNGNGTFTDVTEKAHVDGTDFGTRLHLGATFFDYDRDGKLDLYVGGYVDFGPEVKQTCIIADAESSCPPGEYHGSPDVLYHNNGDGTFTNVTKAAKIYQPNGKNLSVLASDYDNDGWPDLFVANDGMEIYLYHNNHDGTFTESGLMAGVGLTEDGDTMAAMCLSWAITITTDCWICTCPTFTMCLTTCGAIPAAGPSRKSAARWASPPLPRDS